MQNEEHTASDTRRSPGSHCEDTASKPQLNEKTAQRLEKLASWRIDPSLIEFEKGAREFKGGFATVSRALLGSPQDDTEGQVVQSKPGNVKSSERIANLEDGNRRREAEGSNDDAGDFAKEGAAEPEMEILSGTSGWRKPVAVKKMKVKTPDEVSRVLDLALREAEILAGLSHPNITKLKGIVEDVSKGVIWLVLTWEYNGNLKDFVAVRDWEVPERIALIYDVTKGVEYLHTRTPPICHADLKSINILVNWNYRAVITDFGSAHHPATNDLNTERQIALEDPQSVPPVEAEFCASTNTINLTGIHCTIRWAAPEVLRNEEFSLASDIWALGWVAYEVMTDSIPFHDDQEPMAIYRVVRGDLPSISDHVRMLLIGELCSVMGRCWNIEPSKRPTAKDCGESIRWMPKIAPSLLLARSNDPTGLLDRSAELLMQLGNMRGRQSDFSNASNYFAKALDIYTGTGNRSGEANALFGIAEMHQLQHENNQAVTFFSKCLQIRTDIGDIRGRAEAIWGLAQAHLLRDEYGQAATLYSECLQIYTDIGDRGGRAQALCGLGEVHRHRAEYSQAIAFFSEGLQIRTEIGNRRGRAEALWGLAQVHRVRKEYSQAIAFLSEGLQIWTDIGDKQGRASALFALGDVHRLRGEYTQAITFYSEDLQIRTDIGDRVGRAHSLCYLAEMHRFRKEYSQVITFSTEALTILSDLGDISLSAFTLLNLAYAHRDQGHDSDAIPPFEQAAELFKQMGDSNGESFALKQAAGLRRSLEQQESK